MATGGADLVPEVDTPHCPRLGVGEQVAGARTREATIGAPAGCQVGRTAFGQVASIASEKPVLPLQQAISTSLTPPGYEAR